jgi:probable FeS assembly SUF system protein SufT
MAHPMEEVWFSRDVRVVMIPDGYEIPVEEGSRGWITQVLGGNYTVQLDSGRLVRVSAVDADAIGKEALAVASPEEVDLDAEVTDELVWDQLRQCYDPEIPLNIVELGLIYGFELSAHEEGGYRVDIELTLTAPGCGMGQVLADDVEYRVRTIPGVREARIELVFDPPWSPEKMSEAGRLELGMFF